MTSQGFSHIRRLLTLGCAALACLGGSAAAADEDYPSRSITFIVPFPVGGTSDTTIRALTTIVSRIAKQSFVIENRPGASGMIGGQVLARAKPDGYTIGMAPTGANRLSQLGMTTLDLQRDFTLIARVNGQTHGIVTGASSRFKSLADVVAYAKVNPGIVTYASSGMGSTTHVGMEEFAHSAGITLNHIPFKGGAEATVALLGGQVDLMSDSALWAPYVEQGKMRLLATWTEQRTSRFASVPTMKESGYDLVLPAPLGIAGPAGLDQKAWVKLREIFKEAVLSDDFKKEVDKLVAPVMYLDAEDYRKYLHADYAWETQMINRISLKEKMKAN